MSRNNILVSIALFFAVTSVASALYMDPGFTLQSESQCVGGTLLTEYYDIADTGDDAVDPSQEARESCQLLMTGPGQCCDVDYIRSTPTAPAIGSHVWAYKIYSGGTVGVEVSPTDTSLSTFERWAGVSSVVSIPVTASIVANPTSVRSGDPALLTWSSTGATQCTGTNFDTGGSPNNSVLVEPQTETKYVVTCTGPGGSATATATVLVVVPLPSELSVSCRAHPSQAGVGEDVLWASTVSGPQGTYTYSWSGTDSLMGSGSQVFKQYNSQGSKSARLTVTVTPSTSAFKNFLKTPIAHAAHCVAPQTENPPVFNVGGSSCTGGTVIGKTSELLDGVQIGMWPDGWLAEQCSQLGANETDCCEYSQKASNNTGGGFPPNSYYQIRVVRGGSFSQSDSTYIQTAQCSGLDLDYSCSSVAGNIDHSCSTTGGGGGGGGSKTVTVDCDNAVQIGDGGDGGGGGGGGGGQCSDGDDNDTDGAIDEADSDCATNGVYNPNDNSEAPPQCSDGRDNNIDGNVDWPDDPGCSGADDNLEFLEPANITLSANPPLIKKDQQCTITLSASSVTSCSLTGVGISSSYSAVNGFVSTKQVVTPGLQQTATYTLSCKGLDGKTATKKVDCKIAPTFEEI